VLAFDQDAAHDLEDAVTTTEATQATLQELMGGLARFGPQAVAELFADSVDWEVPGDERVPWTGARSTRDEVAPYFETLWSVCDTSRTDYAISHVLIERDDAVELGVFPQTIRATGRRFATPVALHLTVRRPAHHPPAALRGLSCSRPGIRRSASVLMSKLLDLLDARVDEYEAVSAARHPRAMNQRLPKDVVIDFFVAFARRDVEAIMQLVAEDIVEDLAGVGGVTGAAEDRDFLTALGDSFPDLVTEGTRVVAAEHLVAVEWKRRGTFTGRPWRGLPASGKPFEFRGVAVVEVSGERISRIDVYSDTAEFARDIGVLPAEGSAGERFALALLRTRLRVRRVLNALVPHRKAGS
jgi:steroid delta-isomerase-like uncharacterized protein